MVNICESVIKVVTINRRKCLVRLSQNGNVNRKTIWPWVFVTNNDSPADSRHLTQYYFRGGTWKPCISPESNDSGKLTARKAHRGAGLRGWKKRMPSCNVVDTGLNVTRRESEQTSNWSFIAREFEEPSMWRKANDGNG